MACSPFGGASHLLGGWSLSITRPDFHGAILKIERADHHIHQFEAIVRTYVMDNVKALRPEPNPNRWKKRSLGGRIPRHTPTILGDAIHMVINRLDILDASGTPTGGGFRDFSIVVPYGNQAGAIGLEGGMGAKLYGDPRSTFDICFAQGQPFENESILQTLKRLAVVTNNTLVALSRL